MCSGAGCVADQKTGTESIRLALPEAVWDPSGGSKSPQEYNISFQGPTLSTTNAWGVTVYPHRRLRVFPQPPTTTFAFLKTGRRTPGRRAPRRTKWGKAMAVSR